MNDNLALQVGRVILAYGKLDQTLYRSIMSLQLCNSFKAIERSEAPPDDDDIDDRFAHRLKHFRRLILPLVDNQTLGAIDNTLREIRVAEAVRAHLAHGDALEDGDAIRILHHREILAFMEARRADMSAEEEEALAAKHLKITYTREQLRNAAEALTRLSLELDQYTDDAIDLPYIESILKG